MKRLTETSIWSETLPFGMQATQCIDLMDTDPGTSGPDTLVGSHDGDLLQGWDGDDRLEGRGGRDTLEGGKLDDSVYGGFGRDTVYGGDGADLISGGDRGDSIWADDGNDLVAGGRGNDTVYGGAGADVIYGGRGSNQLHGGAGDDWLVGGVNGDWISGDSGNDTVIGGQGNESALFGGEGHDVIWAGAGDDSVLEYEYTRAEVGSDTYYGGSGRDYLSATWMVPGTGLEVHILDDASAVQTLNGDTVTGFESFFIRTGEGDDTLVGGRFVAFDGGEGNDYLEGRDLYGDLGNDTLQGTSGDDSLAGTLDDDLARGGAGNDILEDYDGENWLYGEDGDDVLRQSWGSPDTGERSHFVGGAGADRFQVEWTAVAMVEDFESGLDRAELERLDGFIIGNPLRLPGPGGFSSTSELVIITGDAANLSPAAAAAAIGDATDAYDLNAKAYFVVDDGTDTAVYRFRSQDSDGLVEAKELKLAMTLIGQTDMAIDDFGFF